MTAPELKPCPFCGGDPWFDKPQAYDDRRYMAMHLECCAKIQATLGYRRYWDMRPEDIEAALRKELVAAWNTRADLDAQIMAHPSVEALVEGVKRLRTIIEEIDGAMVHGTWRDEHGRRLKDSPAWVKTYAALAAMPGVTE